MTDDIDNDGTTLHESGGVVQPTDAQIDALWADERLSTPQIVKRRSIARAVLALAVPQAPTKLPIPPSSVDPLEVVYAEGWNACCDAFFGGLPAPEPLVITLTVPPAPLQAEPVPVVASEPVAWAVYWGLGAVRKNSVHFEKATADEVAASIKSCYTEVRPLYAASPSPETAPEPVAAEQGREQGYTDGGRNMFFEGLFDGETERQRKARLTWADDMRAAFERHTGNGWFDKDWMQATSYWAAAWRAALASQSTPPPESAGQGLSDAADMFWDAEDGERFGHDIYEIVAEYGPGEEVNIQRAKRLPNIRVRVVADPDDEDRLTYEILAANPTAQPDGGSKA